MACGWMARGSCCRATLEGTRTLRETFELHTRHNVSPARMENGMRGKDDGCHLETHFHNESGSGVESVPNIFADASGRSAPSRNEDGRRVLYSCSRMELTLNHCGCNHHSAVDAGFSS